MENDPMLVVDEAVYELWRLSNLCHVLTFLKEDSSEVVGTKYVRDVMSLICDALDRQVRLLDGIQWSQVRRRTEARV